MDIDGKKILRGAIAGRPLVTAVGADQVLILDDTDGEPKRALASDLGGGGDMVLADVQTVTGVKTFGTAGGAVGKLKLAGSTSGSTILNAAAAAGSGTVVLPTTGTLATLTGTETLSGKTIDLSGNLTKDGTTFGTDGQGGGNEGIMLTPQGSGVINLNSTVIRANTGDTADLGTVAEPFKTLFLGSAGIDIAGAAIAGDGTGGGNEGIVITPDGTGDVVFASGNVGIGTASPDAPIDFGNLSAGSALIFGDYTMGSGEGVSYPNGFYAGGADDVTFNLIRSSATFALVGAGQNGDTYRRFLIQANGQLNWGSGSGARDVDLYRHAADTLRTSDTLIVDGNVGIGTASPLTRIHVSGPTASTGLDSIALFSETGITPEVSTAFGANVQKGIMVQGSTAAYYIGRAVDSNTEYAMGISGASGNPVFIGSISSSDLELRTGNAAKVTIAAASGNVGIGTTSPTALLEVQAAAGSPGEIALSTAELTVVATDVLGKVSFGAPLESSGTDAVLDGAAIWAVASDTFAADNNSTDLVFATAASETAAERMRIDSSGNVGIGTASPAAFLDVSGAGSGSGTEALMRLSTKSFLSSEVGGPYISGFSKYNGNELFQIAGSSASSTVFGGAVNADTHRRIKIDASGNIKWGSGAATQDVDLYRHAADTLRTSDTLIVDGNVGIGTTSPAQALDVVGSIVASGVANQIPIYTEAHAASHTIDAAECYGGVHYVTAASVVITLPPVAVGMSVTIVSETANMVDINPDGTEVINLDGTAAAAGENINSPGAVGDICVLTYRAANTWYAATNSWVEATP